MKRKVLICGVLLWAALSLCACSGKEAEEENVSETAANGDAEEGRGAALAENEAGGTTTENKENASDENNGTAPKEDGEALAGEEAGGTVNLIGIKAHIKEVQGNELLISSDSDDYPGVFTVTGAEELPEFSNLQGGTPLLILMQKLEETEETGKQEGQKEKEEQEGQKEKEKQKKQEGQKEKEKQKKQEGQKEKEEQKKQEEQKEKKEQKGQKEQKEQKEQAEQKIPKYKAEKIVVLSEEKMIEQDEAAQEDIILTEVPAFTLQDALLSKIDSTALRSGNYTWNVEEGDEVTSVIACGAAPLDEAAMDFTVKLKTPKYNGIEGAPYVFSTGIAPDTLIVRRWAADDIGGSDAKEECVISYYHRSPILELEAGKVYEFTAVWKKENAGRNKFYGNASYVLVTE
ncbi:MAG: hypothetical protein NC400_05100 [Clostridium sp.]|nr:hypothetical protein [Clostridium sp.]